MKRWIALFKRFITYALVGCVDTALDWAAFTAAHELLALTPAQCQTAGYLVGAVSSYLLNGRITFRDGSGHRWLQCIKFITWNVFSLLASAGLISVLTAWGMSAYWAKVLVTLEVALLNYFGYEYLVFHVRKNQTGREKE